MLEYFVSFSLVGGAFGNLEITSKHPITSIQQIRGIEQEIIRLDGTNKQPVVLNYVLLKDNREIV